MCHHLLFKKKPDKPIMKNIILHYIILASYLTHSPWNLQLHILRYKNISLRDNWRTVILNIGHWKYTTYSKKN